jgi:hypothetical protein
MLTSERSRAGLHPVRIKRRTTRQTRARRWRSTPRRGGSALMSAQPREGWQSRRDAPRGNGSRARTGVIRSCMLVSSSPLRSMSGSLAEDDRSSGERDVRAIIDAIGCSGARGERRAHGRALLHRRPAATRSLRRRRRHSDSSCQEPVRSPTRTASAVLAGPLMSLASAGRS